MATGDRDLQVAMAIKANAEQARAELKRTQDELKKTGNAAKQASTGTTALGKATDKTSQAQQRGTEAAKRTATATDSLGKQSDVASQRVTKLGHAVGNLATKAATGNIRGAGSDVAALGRAAAGAAGGIGLALTAVVALVATVATLAVAYAKGSFETDKFNRLLIETGASASTTAGQMEDLVQRTGDATGHYARSVEALQALIGTGRIATNQLELLTRAAVDLATITGGKVADAVQTLTANWGDAYGWAKRMNEQYHVLSASQLDQIRNLQRLGQEEQARAIAQRAISDGVHQRALEVQDSAGIIARSWAWVKSEVDGAWAALKRIDEAQSISDQYKAARAALERAQGTHRNRAGYVVQNASPEAIATLKAQVNTLANQLVQQGIEQTRNAVNQHAQQVATAGADYLAQFAAPIDRLNAAKAKAEKAWHDFMLADHTPEEIDKQKRAFHQAMEQAQKDYEAATKKISTTGGGKGASNVGQQASEQLARQAAAAQQSLTQSLVALQGQLDPTAAAWAQYNAIVAKANADAEKAKGAPGADPAAIEAQRNAIVGLAATMRDAQLDKIAEQDRQSWEELRKELGYPIDADLSKAIAQIEALNKGLEKGRTDAAGYQAMLSRVLQRGVEGKGAPSFQGLSPEIGGAFSDYRRATEAEAQENQYYQGELDRLREFMATKKFTREQGNAELERIEQEHAARLQQIDHAKNYAMVAGLASSFSEAAAAVQAGFGAQSRAYQIAFDLAKGAAIAQSTVAMFQAVAEASKTPWPANIGLMAEAMAQGLAIIADIRAIQMGPQGGYAEGGYTGPGAKYQVAGVVHAGEGVLNQRDIAALGGPAGFEAFRRGLQGYADGGFVHPLAGAPSPSELGFQLSSRSRMAMPDGGTGAGQARPVALRVVNVVDPKLALDALNTPAGEQLIMNTISRNQTKVRQMVR